MVLPNRHSRGPCFPPPLPLQGRWPVFPRDLMLRPKVGTWRATSKLSPWCANPHHAVEGRFTAVAGLFY